MSKDKKRLGRGLSALLNASASPLIQGEMLQTPYTPDVQDSTFSLPGMTELQKEFHETHTAPAKQYGSVQAESGTEDTIIPSIPKKHAAEIDPKMAPEMKQTPAQKNISLEPDMPAKKNATQKQNDDLQKNTFTLNSPFQSASEHGIDLSAPAQEEEPASSFLLLPTSEIHPNPWQPREEFDKKDIQSLADSMKTHGLLQAIVVRKTKTGYEVIAGERRLRAALRLHWEYIPATIMDASDRDMAELALIENLQRKDLNPIEKAISFQDYLQRHDCKQEELAKRLNVDRSTIANFVRLLSLPLEIQNIVRRGELSQGHARAVLPLEDTETQMEMVERIKAEGLSVRQTETIITEWLKGNRDSLTSDASSITDAVPRSRKASIKEIAAPEKSSRLKKKNSHILDLEQQLREAFGLKVKLTSQSGGKGKLEIFFRNHAEFESLMEYLKGE
ncbi:MAG: ParB/RepB/Spo0J family partition protein [Planctomycetia bacterium]|nr:ParB/RepB/Spo0J family partition protein [Planctomycetia bacterium]